MLESGGGSRSVANGPEDTTERIPPMSDDIAGMTLAEFAASRGMGVRAARY